MFALLLRSLITPIRPHAWSPKRRRARMLDRTKERAVVEVPVEGGHVDGARPEGYWYCLELRAQ